MLLAVKDFEAHIYPYFTTRYTLFSICTTRDRLAHINTNRTSDTSAIRKINSYVIHFLLIAMLSPFPLGSEPRPTLCLFHLVWQSMEYVTLTRQITAHICNTKNLPGLNRGDSHTPELTQVDRVIPSHPMRCDVERATGDGQSTTPTVVLTMHRYTLEPPFFDYGSSRDATKGRQRSRKKAA